MATLAQTPVADTLTLDEFARLTAAAAGEIHDKFMVDRKKLQLSRHRSVASLLPQLAELGVITATEVDRLANLIGVALDDAVPYDAGGIEALKNAITGDAAASPVAVAIAGVVADSAAKAAASAYNSVAGADAVGAVIGGVAGAIAGAIVTKTPTGAIAGGAFGAVVVGGLASMEEAGWI